jgi:hypothetical protein
MISPDSRDADDLSREADAWLTAAGEEFNLKQQTLQAEWLGHFQHWEFDPTTGVLTLFQPNGSCSLAGAEILGSFSKVTATWEWAWSNPNMPSAFSKKSLLVKGIGESLGLEYLRQGIVPIPRDVARMSSYLCSVGVKATDAAGVFVGGDDHLPVYFLVFDPTLVRK